VQRRESLQKQILSLIFTFSRYASASASRDTTKQEEGTVKTQGRPQPVITNTVLQEGRNITKFFSAADNICVLTDMIETGLYNSQRGVYLIDFKQTDTDAVIHLAGQKVYYKAQVLESTPAANPLCCKS